MARRMMLTDLVNNHGGGLGLEDDMPARDSAMAVAAFVRDHNDMVVRLGASPGITMNRTAKAVHQAHIDPDHVRLTAPSANSRSKDLAGLAAFGPRIDAFWDGHSACLLYTSPSPRD